MSLFIESIKLLDGEYHNLFYHEQRMNRSLKVLCGVDDHLNLEEFLNLVEKPGEGLYKCRIVYDDKVKEVEFVPYQPRVVKRLKVVEHDRISYEFKYADRTAIDDLFQRRENCDDILIVKNGLVTDSSYSNIVFRRGNHWYTPWSALLKGTIRTKLLEHNIIEEEEIRVDEIATFSSFKLINAMLEFDSGEIDVSNILL
jgi:4-amino-4-deoxychorismate lyase